MRVEPFSEVKDWGGTSKDYGFPGRKPAGLQAPWRKNETMKYGTHIGTKKGQETHDSGTPGLLHFSKRKQTVDVQHAERPFDRE
jgi:hypothetical protein